MYLRVTQRHNRDGSSVTYYALAESVWNADEKRREAHVVHSFGRADQLDRAELERLVRSINRVLDDGDDAAGSAAASDRPEIEIEGCSNLVWYSPPTHSGKNSESGRPSADAPNRPS